MWGIAEFRSVEQRHASTIRDFLKRARPLLEQERQLGPQDEGIVSSFLIGNDAFDAFRDIRRSASEHRVEFLRDPVGTETLDFIEAMCTLLTILSVKGTPRMKELADELTGML